MDTSKNAESIKNARCQSEKYFPLRSKENHYQSRLHLSALSSGVILIIKFVFLLKKKKKTKPKLTQLLLLRQLVIPGLKFLPLHLTLALTEFYQCHFHVRGHFRDLSENATDVIDESSATGTELQELDGA